MNLKNKLKNNITTIGSWITLGHTSVAEIMGNAGFDWLVIDMEHSIIELSDVQKLVQVIDSANIPSIVRPTSNNDDVIKRVMDAGAHGVMVPFVNSAEDAKKVVESVYYPPKGKRGVGLARAQKYGAFFGDYLSWLEENAIVIVMIEHITAVNNIDDIFSVEGVDGFMIGPYDLSASIGLAGQLSNPKVTDLVARVQDAGERHGVPGGIHVVEPEIDNIGRFIERGFSFIGYGMDVRILDSVCRSHLKEIRKII